MKIVLLVISLVMFCSCGVDSATTEYCQKQCKDNKVIKITKDVGIFGLPNCVCENK